MSSSQHEQAPEGALEISEPMLDKIDGDQTDHLQSGSALERIAGADDYAFCVWQTVDAFASSLHSEFDPNEDAVTDWRHSLTLLRSCVSPLVMWADLAARTDVSSLGNRAYLAWRIDRSVQNASKILLQPERTPSQRLGDAGVALWGTVEALRIWTEYSSESEDSFRRVSPPIKTPMIALMKPKSLLQKYFHNLRELANCRYAAADNRNLTKQCMASRKLYIVSYAISCVCPEEWTMRGYKEFRSLHELLLGNIPGGSHYRSSIRTRMLKAEESRVLNLGQPASVATALACG